MGRFPKKCLVDTNVPITANCALEPDSIPNDLVKCVSSCIEAIEHVISNGVVVLDADGEIFDEYSGNLDFSGQPGVGDFFLKWLHDHRWEFPESDRVPITKLGTSYVEFPKHEELDEFDLSDRKFIAVANAHTDKPPILQATDSKWWGWSKSLEEVGIRVYFLCPEYVEKRSKRKIGK